VIAFLVWLGAVTLRLFTATLRFAAQALLSTYADALAAMPGETTHDRIVSLHLAAVGAVVALPTLILIAALVIVALGA
jgi:hypothetical protein